MSRYSLEPPRRNLITYHSFDTVSGDTVLDYSPQSVDGAVVGDVDLGHTGVVGNAARMRDEQNHVAVSGLSQFLPMAELTASVWGRSEKTVRATENNVSATAAIGGNTYTLTHSVDEEVDGWQFALATYDGQAFQLWYGRASDDGIVLADEVEVNGDVSQFDVTVFTTGYGYVDEVRVYRDGLSRDWHENLHEIGASQPILEALGDQWESVAIPFRGTNRQLSGALASTAGERRRQLDAVLESIHIEDAAGEQLNRIGGGFGIGRKEGERDDKYRARIQARLAAGRSHGTFSDLLSAASTILDVPVERIELDAQYESDPGAAFMYLQTPDIEASPLSTTEIEDILQDAVLAGHRLSVIQQGENPFEIIDSSMTNDPDRGLTADDISTGGGLISDI